jgi:uncharacterized SAM-binding protein YcdF (DUF218 family)
MAMIAAFIKEFLLPGTFLFFLIGVTTGVVLLSGRRIVRPWGTRILVVLTILYWLLSVPAVSHRLLFAAISPHATAGDLDAPMTSAQALVVLGNGIHRFKVRDVEINTVSDETAYTLIESVRLYRRLGSPLMIVSGGISHPEVYKDTEADVLRDALLAQGVPGDRILTEGHSRTTRQQALDIAPMLREHGIVQFALVTSPIHMPRAVAAFLSEGLHAIPAPSAYGAPETEYLHSAWRPSTAALMLSQRAVYEDAGLVYYWIRGWLTPRRGF